jgi:hypothetical protein
MSDDPWRLPTDAATRAVNRCFRLPTLELAVPVTTLEDPETLLERLFGRYLPGSDAAVTGGTAVDGGFALSPSVSSSAAAVRASAPVDEAPPPARAVARQASPLETLSRTQPQRTPAAVPTWPASGLAGLPGLPGPPDRPGPHPGSNGGAGTERTGWTSDRAADRPDGLPATADHHTGSTPPPGAGRSDSHRAARLTEPAERAATAVARPGNEAVRSPTTQTDHTSASSADATAARSEPVAPSRSATPPTSVTRLGRGAAQLAAVLRADTADDPAELADPRQTDSAQPDESPWENPRLTSTNLGRPHGDSTPVDQVLVATVTEEVAGRLREELEWEFQRTYGMGG